MRTLFPTIMVMFMVSVLAGATERRVNTWLVCGTFECCERPSFETDLVGESSVWPAPAMVFYHGYSGSRSEVYHYLPWTLQGYAVFAIDVRGQSGASTDSGLVGEALSGRMYHPPTRAPRKPS